jgi:hypothetical protein
MKRLIVALTFFLLVLGTTAIRTERPALAPGGPRQSLAAQIKGRSGTGPAVALPRGELPSRTRSTWRDDLPGSIRTSSLFPAQ